MTWGSGSTGVSGIVSAANSLVGSNGDPLSKVTVLSNGNYLLVNPSWNGNRGAITWGNGNTGVTGAISAANSLVGSNPGDLVGTGVPSRSIPGVTVLSNGNYVVDSPNWSGNRGAVTWGSSTTGVSGTVSEANRLVGSNPGDYVGGSDPAGSYVAGGVSFLSNGNYVVDSPFWSDDRGAVTWGNGGTGVSGIVSPSNSVVGSNPEDYVGLNVDLLTNGNYIVESPLWNSARGAASWGNGSTGVSGIVSSINSLVGSDPEEYVGYVVPLTNGNYVVDSPYWNGNRGAVTWGSGSTGIGGTISEANSLVGSHPGRAFDDPRPGPTGDSVGLESVTPLSDGNYLVDSPLWNGARGAVTWGDGNRGVSGILSDANSLVGDTSGDLVGVVPDHYFYSGVTTLSNGNYVILSGFWNNGRGAVTWGNGSTGVRGIVSDSNSLVGTNSKDGVGEVTPLSNGDYVVVNPGWNGNRGAVTWGSGGTGVSGTVSDANSLVGSNSGDYLTGDNVGSGGVTQLSNGNFVILSPHWSSGRGAVTWGNGSSMVTGVVSDTNSLVGGNLNDLMAFAQFPTNVIPLSNGDYVVRNPSWNDGRGAVTWVNGSKGITGTISDANSLVGSNPGDDVGSFVPLLSNGNYLVQSPGWNGARGAVTWGNADTGISGAVSQSNSLVGGSRGDNVGNGVPMPPTPGVILLSNGNYLVVSSNWSGARGAVTWGNGSTGVSGTVSDTNSLVGTDAGDRVGLVAVLSNGNYVVRSPYWNGSRGAVTWGNGATGIIGDVSGANSLIGSDQNDRVGVGFTPLSDGKYVVLSPYWNGERGAVTWVNGADGQTLDGMATITPQNSIIGTSPNAGLSLIRDFIENPMNQTFLAAFLNEGAGRVTVGYTDPSRVTYGTARPVHNHHPGLPGPDPGHRHRRRPPG